MTPEVFAEWLNRQGYNVIRTASSYWFEISPRILQAFPYHWLITPDEEELGKLLLTNRIVGLRFSSDFRSGNGAVSYHVICKDHNYSMENLPKKARYDVRYGMSNVNVRPISFSRLATEGWQLRLDTLVRQGRSKAESKTTWESLCRTAIGLPGFEAWAAIAENRLAATLLTFTCDDCCSILYQQSSTELLRLRVNNALTYAFTTEILNRPQKTWLFYGLHSLDAPPTVDKYKFRMGYQAQPVRQRVLFHPMLAPVFNTTSHAIISRLMNQFPTLTSLAKAEGMLRFYLQGKRKDDKQDWPEGLARSKGELLDVMQSIE